jgi:RNA polymerase sigma-32 factor
LNEEPVTLREIGEKYGISRERVRQIEERVKKKLKIYLKDFKDVSDSSRP